MNRKILFRGKPIKPYGHIVLGNGEKYIEFEYGGYFKDDCYGGCPEGKHYIVFSNTAGLGYIDTIQVIPETVGQDTGLKDKNGVSIFEGDIVKISYKGRNKFGIIESLGYEFSIKDMNNMYWSITSVPLEVIGNTTDNQEFLEVR